MIFYSTQETLKRYKIKTHDQFDEYLQPLVRKILEKEKGSALYEWGCKLFHFDKRKCLQLVHFKTRFTIFLVDIKMADFMNVPNVLAQVLIWIYDEDIQMKKALEKYFAEAPIACFDRITNKSIIA